MAKAPASTLDTVIALAKKRGFVFPAGEIYGGTRSASPVAPCSPPPASVPVRPSSPPVGTTAAAAAA